MKTLEVVEKNRLEGLQALLSDLGTVKKDFEKDQIARDVELNPDLDGVNRLMLSSAKGFETLINRVRGEIKMLEGQQLMMENNIDLAFPSLDSSI